MRTGQYRLDAWSAANMPVQIYLAAGLAKVFGYSLSVLRVSTLLLLAGGLAALYGLLRRTSLPAWPAAVREVLHSFWKVVALVPYRSARCATRYLQVRQRQAPQSADTEPFPAPAVASPTR